MIEFNSHEGGSMAWRLPPLKALRAFEAAGRNLSFTLAARELNVTTGAVSRQIKLLEEFVGTALFKRANREVTLTAPGATYLEALTDVFARTHAATARIAAVRDNRGLRLSCTMTFSLRWLLPRLISFHTAQPGLDIQLTTSIKPVDLRVDDFDAAIRFGQGQWTDIVSHRLFGADLVPVCNPTLLLEGPPLRKLADLSRYTLLHSTARPDNWRKWLDAMGVQDIADNHGMHFESSSLAFQAAIEGMGIAMGQLQLVAEDLATGRLVMPFHCVVPDIDSFYLLYSDAAARVKAFQRFRNWLLEEARIDVARVETIKKTIRAKPRDQVELATVRQ
jgi:LysR family transcriptional regulator, glycine cleavage system transcriptional activator